MKTTFLFLLTLLGSAPAQSFSLLYSWEPRWQQNEVPVDYNNDNCPAGMNLSTMLPAALERYWNSVPFTRLKLTLGEQKHVDLADDGRIFVTCGDESYFTGTFLAVAFASLSVSTGDPRIKAASVIMRIAHNWAGETSDYSISVIGHELGHAIGFGHSTSINALMLSGWNGTNLMDPDDRAAIEYLYPRDEMNKGAFGCGTVAGGRRPPVKPTHLALLFFPLLLALGFRLGVQKLGAPGAVASFS